MEAWSEHRKGLPTFGCIQIDGSYCGRGRADDADSKEAPVRAHVLDIPKFSNGKKERSDLVKRTHGD